MQTGCTLTHACMQAGVLGKRHDLHNDTLAGIQELLVYGLKGLAAYAHHAERLGASDTAVYAFVHRALAFLASTDADDASAVLDMCLEAGRVNFRVMQLLDEAHTTKCALRSPPLTLPLLLLLLLLLHI
jgi:hydroxylamine reductase